MKKDAVYLIVGAAAYGMLMYIVVSNNMETQTIGDMQRAAEARRMAAEARRAAEAAEAAKKPQPRGYFSSRRFKK